MLTKQSMLNCPHCGCYELNNRSVSDSTNTVHVDLVVCQQCGWSYNPELDEKPDCWKTEAEKEEERFEETFWSKHPVRSSGVSPAIKNSLREVALDAWKARAATS